jgi:hypothetical protein
MTRLPHIRSAHWSRDCLGIAVAASIMGASGAAAQSAGAGTPWNGWARCDVDVTAAGYSDRQSHVWVVPATSPVSQGAVRVHAATWSASGSGSLRRTQGSQTLDAQWTTAVPAMDAPFAFTVRASDGRLLIKPWHAQRRVRGAISGSQQLTIDGKPQRPVPIALEAFEWGFPAIEADTGTTRLAGSSAPPVTGSVAPMQPAGARSTASCSWAFARGSVVSSPATQTATATSTAPLTATSSATTAASGATTAITRMPRLGEVPSASSQPAAGAEITLSRTGDRVVTSASAPICSTVITSVPQRTDRLTIPSSQPTMPCVPLSQRLDEMGYQITEAVASLLQSIVTLPQSARGSAEACTQYAGEVDAAFASLMSSVQVQYDQLLLAKLTAEEQDTVSKQAALQLAALRTERDKALAAIRKLCEQL